MKGEGGGHEAWVGTILELLNLRVVATFVQ